MLKPSSSYTFNLKKIFISSSRPPVHIQLPYPWYKKRRMRHERRLRVAHRRLRAAHKTRDKEGWYFRCQECSVRFDQVDPEFKDILPPNTTHYSGCIVKGYPDMLFLMCAKNIRSYRKSFCPFCCAKDHPLSKKGSKGRRVLANCYERKLGSVPPIKGPQKDSFKVIGFRGKGCGCCGKYMVYTKAFKTEYEDMCRHNQELEEGGMCTNPDELLCWECCRYWCGIRRCPVVIKGKKSACDCVREFDVARNLSGLQEEPKDLPETLCKKWQEEQEPEDLPIFMCKNCQSEVNK